MLFAHPVGDGGLGAVQPEDFLKQCLPDCGNRGRCSNANDCTEALQKLLTSGATQKEKLQLASTMFLHYRGTGGMPVDYLEMFNAAGLVLTVASDADPYLALETAARGLEFHQSWGSNYPNLGDKRDEPMFHALRTILVNAEKLKTLGAYTGGTTAKVRLAIEGVIDLPQTSKAVRDFTVKYVLPHVPTLDWKPPIPGPGPTPTPSPSTTSSRKKWLWVVLVGGVVAAGAGAYYASRMRPLQQRA